MQGRFNASEQVVEALAAYGFKFTVLTVGFGKN
jgi:hypothetical protein